MNPRLSIRSGTLLVVVLLIVVVGPIFSFRSDALSKSKWFSNGGIHHYRYQAFSSFRQRTAVPMELSATTLPVKTILDENRTSATSTISSDVIVNSNTAKSKLLLEFEEKIEVFYSYSHEDIACIANRRDRALFEGVAASRDEPLVYHAFALLFENLLPLRVAGRAMFSRMKRAMDRSIQQRDEQVQRLTVATGLLEDEIAASQITFLEFAPKFVKNEAIVPLQYFRDSGMAQSLADKMGYSSVDTFLQKLAPDGRKKLNFEDFMMGLHRCAIDDDLCTLECDLSKLLQQVIEGVEALPPPTPNSSRLKHEKRYGEMLESFEKWQNLLPANSEGFWEEVLRGCLQGAQNPRVVEALKIVYVDDMKMRVAGNAIFFGVKTVVAMLRK